MATDDDAVMRGYTLRLREGVGLSQMVATAVLANVGQMVKGTSVRVHPAVGPIAPMRRDLPAAVKTVTGL